ncbi:hypothetical protein [Flavobacterium sp. GP15]|uniref:hypothetical protein n=1 Tax=Flavobacterium sp. GP15 TaxID=2758567 RepID=UPI00165DDD5E|nr:hypothetical protein [Flavobacterium sp. GP15]
MRNILLLLTLSLLIFSCETKKSEDFHPDIMKPNWDGITPENIKYKFGDAVSIFIDKQYYIGIIMDINQDKAGIWYGICLSDYRSIIPNQKKINELNFFARNIPSGFSGDCVSCYDLSYLNENSVSKNIRVFENVKIDIDKISIGASSPAKNLKQLENDYFNAIKVRKQKPTECDEEILNPKRVAERYFKIENVLME